MTVSGAAASVMTEAYSGSWLPVKRREQDQGDANERKAIVQTNAGVG